MSCVGVDQSRTITIFCCSVRPMFSVMCGPSCFLFMVVGCSCYFFVINNFLFSFFYKQHNIISKIKQNKTKQQTHTQHLKVQSKGRERGKDNKNTKVTPLNNHVHSVKNTAKPQWLKAWPHRLAPLYTHMRQFAGGYGSNMPLYTCVV